MAVVESVEVLDFSDEDEQPIRLAASARAPSGAVWKIVRMEKNRVEVES
jgi:hypothetical protein